MLNLNPNINFLLDMNDNPHINQPPNMVPAGSLNIPLFEDAYRNRLEEEARRKEERYHIRNPTFVPPAPFLPPISLPKSYESPVYTPKSYEPPALSYIPPKLDILPIKNFWDKKNKY